MILFYFFLFILFSTFLSLYIIKLILNMQTFIYTENGLILVNDNLIIRLLDECNTEIQTILDPFSEPMTEFLVFMLMHVKPAVDDSKDKILEMIKKIIDNIKSKFSKKKDGNNGNDGNDDIISKNNNNSKAVDLNNEDLIELESEDFDFLNDFIIDISDLSSYFFSPILLFIIIIFILHGLFGLYSAYVDYFQKNPDNLNSSRAFFPAFFVLLFLVFIFFSFFYFFLFKHLIIWFLFI